MSMSCERHPDKRKCRCRTDRESGKSVEHQSCDLLALTVEIVLDDDLNAERHVVGARQDEEKHQDRVEGLGEISGDRALFCSDISERRADEPYGERNERNRRHALMPDMLAARSSCAPTL